MLLQHLLEVAPGVGARMLRDLFRSAGHHNLATLVTALGTKVNDPIGAANHIEVVLSYSKILVGI